jgi:biopolymer transport protein ExbD
MSAHFKKKTKTKQEIPTTAMPDIVFMLLIFFMVTTVLREVTLMVKVDFVKAENIQKIDQKRLVSYIYIGPERLSGNRYGETKVQIDDQVISDVPAIRNIMYDKLLDQPKLIVSLRIDRKSEMGLVTDVKEELRKAGTLRINYSSKREL